MSTWVALYAQQPGWAWLGVAAVLLAAELVTGSGYLLWPSASAGVTAGLVFLGWPDLLVGQILLFAILTLASTYAARRWWPPARRSTEGPDLNDWRAALVGRVGETLSIEPDLRVFVDGKSWAAEAAGAAPLLGQRVRVVEVVGGSRLRVEPF